MKRLAYLVALVASLTLLTGTTAAIAGTHPDNRATHGPGAVALEQQTGVVRPDDHAIHGQGAIALEQLSGAGRPDDRASHGPGAIAFEQVPVVEMGDATAGQVDGFDWLDATIGAAAALGLVLIAAGGVAVVHRRGQAPAYS